MNTNWSILYIGSNRVSHENLFDKLTESSIAYEFYDIGIETDALCNKCAENCADMVIIDDTDYKANTIDLVKAILKVSNKSVMVITCKNDVFSEILALELGADEYLVKPSAAEQVLARIRNILRRKNKDNVKVNENEVRYPGLVVNISQYTAEIDGKRVKMPPKELELLYLLASNPNVVYTREKLLDMVWGYDFDIGSRTVDVHIKRLRDKIEKNSHRWSIGTVWSIGYRFEIIDDVVSEKIVV